jgi:hypothetical protein
MKGAKQGQNAPRERIVKTNNKLKVVVSILLAITGTVIFTLAYQYSHQAKLEAEFNKKQTELQQLQQLHQETINGSKEQQERIKQLEAELQAKKERANTLAVLKQRTASASSVKVTGTKADWMRAAGIPQSQWQYVDYIVSKESGWNPNAVNKSSGACSLAQSLPCSKIGPNWNDPVVALKWQYNYVNARYGGYAGAYTFWLNNHWY